MVATFMLRRVQRPRQVFVFWSSIFSALQASFARGVYARRIALILAVFSTGCSSLKVPSTPFISRVELRRLPHDEADELSHADILDGTGLQALEHVAGIKAPWASGQTYAPDLLQKDLQTVLKNYRNKGYRDVRIVAARVLRDDKQGMQVTLLIEPGPRTKILSVRMVGVESLASATQRRIRKALLFRAGDAFDEKLLRHSWTSVRRALDDEGYARARVHVKPSFSLADRSASIEVRIEPGQTFRIGTIQFEGLLRLRETDVRRVLQFKRGDIYSIRMLRRAELSLADVGIFSSVQVIALPRTNEPGTIGILVRLKEKSPVRTLARAAIASDSAYQTLVPSLSFQHRNVWGGLRKFEADVRLPMQMRLSDETLSPSRFGILGMMKLTQPSFLDAQSQAAIMLQGGIEPDVNNPFRNQFIALSLGIGRRWGPFVQTQLSYLKRFDWPVAYGSFVLPANVRKFEQGIFELLTTVDTRDDSPRPHEGIFSSTSLEASLGKAPGIGGSQADVRFSSMLKLYAPLARQIVLSARLRFGFLVPFFANPREPSRLNIAENGSSFAQDQSSYDLPWQRVFVSGGQLSNRGYTLNGIGLRDCLTSVRQYETGRSCSAIVGGASLWEASLEARWDTSQTISLRAFLDASDVSRNTLDVRLSAPHLSTGFGLDATTLLGTFHVDVGVRIPGLQRVGESMDAREEPRPFQFLIRGPFAFHFALEQPL